MMANSKATKKKDNSTWVIQKEGGIRFGATTKSMLSYIFMPISLVSAIIFCAAFILDAMDGPLSMWVVSFIMITFLLLASAFLTFGKVEIAVVEGRGLIFVGIGKIGTKRYFWLDEVKQIKDKMHKGNVIGYHLILTNGKKLLFAENLPPAKRPFMKQTMQQVLNNNKQHLNLSQHLID